MRLLDDPPLSWRVDQGDSDVLQIGLFVRDAAGLDISGLDVPGALDIPPLAGISVADVAVDLRAAGQQWASWWQQLLEVQFADRPAPAPGVDRGRNRARYLLARWQAVCDPPDFDALADRPELQAAAQAVFDDHHVWGRLLPQRRTELDWALLKQTAEDVAFDHRVSIDRVRAHIVFLPVDGVWWARVRPGCVLCSAAAVDDPVTAQTLVRDAFVSGLAVPQ
ncbi:hypothetical protein [uncultured Jatrophihabitans sp.]|uniref:hypothetical protein n=1 Tax=uncultured Jatrophihabitans sp. TaxID=1610747 RepID=UPI0035CA5A81